MPATALRKQSRADLVLQLLATAPRLPDGETCAECGKRRFATPQAAGRVIARREAARDKSEKRAYYKHGWWHLTSQDNRED